MGERMRAHPWSCSPLGKVDSWPSSLRVAVSLMLQSRHPVFIVWGPELTFLYNDACIPILGDKHPTDLGRPFTQVWPDECTAVWPIVRRALSGEPGWAENVRILTQHSDESWWTISSSPLCDERANVMGAFCTCMDTTAHRMADQRLGFQLRLGERLGDLSDAGEILRVAAASLGQRLKAARVGYAFDQEDPAEARFEGWEAQQAAIAPLPPLYWQGFGASLLAELRAGRPVRVYDWSADERVPPATAIFPAVGVMLVPLMQHGKLQSVLYVCAQRPRHWSDVELAVAQDVALRTRLATQRARAIRARHTAEEALQQQLLTEAERLRQLFEYAPGFMAVLRGPELVFELANRALTRIVGRADLLGKPAREALPELEGQRVFELLEAVYASGRPSIAEELSLLVAQPHPERRYISVVCQPLFAADGKTRGVFVIGHDVTELRRAHDALREREARLRLALRAARMAEITIRYTDGTVTHSASCAQMFGYPADQKLTIEHLRARYHPEDAPIIDHRRDELFASDENFLASTHRILWPDGTTRWLSIRGEIERDANGRPSVITAVYIDVTEQQRALQALQQSEAQFQAFAQAIPNLIWVADARAQVEWVNDRFYDYVGRESQVPISQRWREVVHPDDVPPALERWIPAMKTGCVFESEMRLRSAGGEYRWFIGRALPLRDYKGNVMRWIGSLTDIHDQKTIAAELAALNATLESRVEERSRELRIAEEALRHAQKMEAVGQLTGGIAHDFNNLLTGIIGGLEIVQQRIASGRIDDAERFRSAAHASATRAAALTQRLLAFSRQQQLDAKPLQINDLVRSMTELLGRTLDENISLHLDLDPQLWLTEVDKNQLESALLNLTINARAAMPMGGRVTISTWNVDLQPHDADRDRELHTGEYVVLRVSDTGAGMSPEVLQRAFDPFFTTKPVGQGTGLGLSMIYGFVKQSRGHVRLESELGCGTTVTLYLPRYAGPLPEAEAPPKEVLPPAQAGETVLIVEDDAAVRMLVVEVLEELGYRFIEAADGTQAVLVLQSSQPVDLLITDVGLPGMSGREIAQLARSRHPDIKVLFITGYANETVNPQRLLEPGMQLVKKPFALEALARKIREMLQPTT
jgi:PAS domain S-box-containing protein